jgi:hypothetical protein
MSQDPEESEQLLPPRKKLPKRAWEGYIEKQIREAMERGDFENLSGEGKPLDLRYDPNVPAEWQLAFKVLKDAGYAPDWIEQDKAIREALENLDKPFQRYLARRPASRDARAAREEKLIAEFRQVAAELNRSIDLFNLKAPVARLHRRRIRIEDEIEKFREACAI